MRVGDEPRPALPRQTLRSDVPARISETFPLELRAQAISFFFAIARFFGGVIAPALFGR